MDAWHDHLPNPAMLSDGRPGPCIYSLLMYLHLAPYRGNETIRLAGAFADRLDGRSICDVRGGEKEVVSHSAMAGKGS